MPKIKNGWLYQHGKALTGSAVNGLKRTSFRIQGQGLQLYSKGQWLMLPGG